ncbi:NUDIX domain-containing protein [Nocardia ignorata]|uniref:NUDIX domain-containing protein n=1 Tax=Nocardia ignorata TaxID=145285 RepID=A0A4V3CMF0_NOCIG|nr:NUDIX domain-containing protein [Nocardia ignorata]TDP28615.1 NUDIX domain-containing protein [Nocardia ignorata]
MAISDSDISDTLAAYLEDHPDEATLLSEPMRLLRGGHDFASRRTFPMHVTVGALLVRQHSEVLLVRHKAYGGMLLQPGGHLEENDVTLIDAAVRELAEETGLDPSVVALESPNPVYIEYGPVPARPLSEVVKVPGQVVAGLPVEAREFRHESWPTCKVAMHGDQ